MRVPFSANGSEDASDGWDSVPHVAKSAITQSGNGTKAEEDGIISPDVSVPDNDSGRIRAGGYERRADPVDRGRAQAFRV